MNFFQKLKNIKDPALMAERVITWCAPVLLIPALRYVQDSDKPKDLRNELFVRDLSSWALGTGIYFASLIVAAKTMNSGKIFKTASEGTKRIATISAAVGAYCTWSGFLGPKFSKFIMKKGLAESSNNDCNKFNNLNDITFRANTNSYKALKLPGVSQKYSQYFNGTYSKFTGNMNV